jgi:hypothetical protein
MPRPVLPLGGMEIERAQRGFGYTYPTNAMAPASSCRWETLVVWDTAKRPVGSPMTRFADGGCGGARGDNRPIGATGLRGRGCAETMDGERRERVLRNWRRRSEVAWASFCSLWCAPWPSVISGDGSRRRWRGEETTRQHARQTRTGGGEEVRLQQAARARPRCVRQPEGGWSGLVGSRGRARCDWGGGVWVDASERWAAV